MKIKLTQIPSDGYCWHEDGSICPYYDPVADQHRCRLWDFFGVDYEQKINHEGVINNICTWTKEVIV